MIRFRAERKETLMVMLSMEQQDDEKEKDFSLWRTKYTPLVFVHLLLNWAFYLFAPIIPVLFEDLGTKDLTTTAVMIFMGTSYVARLIVGFLCDRFHSKGMKRIGLLAVSLMLLSFVGYALMETTTQLFLCRFLHGLAYGMAVPPITGYIYQIIPERKSLMGHAGQKTAGDLGMALGCSLSLVLTGTGQSSLSVVFTLSIAVVAVALIVLVAVPKPDSVETQKTGNPVFQEKRLTKSMQTSQVIKAVIPFGLIMCFVCFYTSAVTTFIVPYAKEMGYTEHGWSFMLCNTSTILVSSFFVSWLTHSRRAQVMFFFHKKTSNYQTQEQIGRWLTIAAFSCFAIGVAGLTVHSLPLFYAAAVANGIGASFLSSPIRAKAMEFVVDEKRRPLATSIYYTIYDVGAFVSPLIGLLAVQWPWGYQFVWVPVGALVGIGAILAFVYLRRTPPAKLVG
jgi:MFS family permease